MRARFGNKRTLGIGKVQGGRIENDLAFKGQRTSSGGRTNLLRYREAVLAACDHLERQKEFEKQHGAVRVIMKDGRLLDPGA
jgi:ribosomal protein S13